MKILFIGGSGNISTDCAALLYERGHEILTVTRGRNTLPVGYQAIHADRKQPDTLREALKNVSVDIVIDFLGYELEDVQNDFKIFQNRIQQFIFISSTTVYVKPAPTLPMTEQTPVGNAYWDYAQKKLLCELWLQERYSENRFPVTIVRPSHTYSKRWVPNPVSSTSYTFATRMEQGKPVFVPNDGEIPWTLTATSDFAVGLAGLVGNNAAIGESFHITSDEVLTWNQICAEIADGLGVKSPNIEKVPLGFICEKLPRMIGTLKGDKANPGVFDNSKIKRFVPEFRCKKPFRVGIRESIEWLRNNPDQQNLNPAIDAEIDLVVDGWRAVSKDLDTITAKYIDSLLKP